MKMIDDIITPDYGGSNSVPYPIILEGVTGSQAYGLSTENSDVDVKGVYVAPTHEIIGLYKPHDTYDHVDPDWVYYELGKFIKLAMGCNPSIIELLYLEGYLQLTKFGKMLVDNRHIFLSNTVKKSYGGYALQQARKLNARGGTFGNGRNNRYEKHARHCFRLLFQGRELLRTGNLTVRVSPELREELFEIGTLPVPKLVERFEREFKEFDAIPSVLPDQPDKEAINRLLLRIRKGNP